VLNGIYLLPKSALSDTGSVVFELAYSQLTRVTSHPELFKAEGSAVCRAAETPAVNASGSKDDGCSTKQYLGAAVNFTPQWLQVQPSWDLDLPMSLNYGLRGNAASGGGGSQGSVSWSIGAKLSFAQRHEFTLRYADTLARPAKFNAAGTALIGGNGGVANTDRAWVSFTYKTGF
jgi:hypothetical protein